jgi:hypothetical protein
MVSIISSDQEGVLEGSPRNHGQISVEPISTVLDALEIYLKYLELLFLAFIVLVRLTVRKVICFKLGRKLQFSQKRKSCGYATSCCATFWYG